MCPCRVLAASEGLAVAETPFGARAFRLAASCLLRPEPGDLVLAALPEAESAQAFILAVLERSEAASPAMLDLPAGAVVSAMAGSVRIEAAQGISLSTPGEFAASAGSMTFASEGVRWLTRTWSVIGKTLEFVAERLTETANERDTQARTWTQRLGDCFRHVEELDETQAGMGGVILLVAANLLDAKGIRHILHTDKSEAAVLLATFLATLFVQMEFAIFCGVLLSLLLYLKRTSHPSFIVLAPDPDSLRRPLVNVRRKAVPECPQLKILRLDGSIFFGAVTHISEELHRIMDDFPEQCHILIVGGGINFIDASGCHMLFNEALSLKLSGRDMSFCSLKTEVREVLDRGMCVRRLGGEHIFESESEAIAHMVPRLDPERCACCHMRVFRECERMPGGEHHMPLREV